METRNEYLHRTRFMKEPVMCDSNGLLIPPMDQIRKVAPDGSFSFLYGDTVLFDLTDCSQTFVSLFQTISNRMGSAAMLSGSLLDSAHLTLHDLDVWEEQEPERVLLEDRKNRIVGILSGYRSFHARITPVAIFNMVNRSLVLGFAPADDESWESISGLYEQFNRFHPLPYPLTLHMTMFYFRPRIFCKKEIDALNDVLAEVNDQIIRDPFELELTGNMLRYCTFTDMNSYTPY